MPILDGTQPAAVRRAAERLAAGELVAFATETVYGLGARADDDAAVARIFSAKGRPADHPLIVHLAQPADAEHFAAGIPVAATRLMAAFWPGPLTLIVPRRPGRGAAAAGGQASIGLRVPAHPVAQALLSAAAELGVPGVAAPSANRFGRVSPTTAQHVADEFGAELWVLDGGACAFGIESAIVDCSRGGGGATDLPRPGQRSPVTIERVLGMALAAADAASPRASGTLESHYAPSAPVSLLDAGTLAARLAAAPGRSTQGPAVYSRLAPAAGWWQRRMPDDAAAVAHELFAVLREFDAMGAPAIWVEEPPPGPEWEGVRDRLRRAAS
jgi:L-threonylcarbamoyladenylate synthase